MRLIRLIVVVAGCTVPIVACGSDPDREDGAGGSSTGTGGSGALAIDDPLYQQPTTTMAEWITPEYYTCQSEQSACGLPCPSDGLWVAINSTDFRNSQTCSACMHVIGPRGEVTVEVIENCAGACAEGEIELSREAFEQIGDLAEGHAQVRWVLVPCERVGPIRFSYELDSDPWWAGIQIRNPVLPVSTLAIRYSEQVGWVELGMDGWNHFPVSGDLGSGPFDFQVTAINGQTLLEQAVAYVPGGVVDGTGQFE